MCLKSVKNLRKMVFLVVFFLLYSVLDVCADDKTKLPFVIFQPGEFFDPFTEQSLRDHQTSASAVQQPNVIFGDSKAVFNQPFWHLPKGGAYPRTVGHTSGNAAQVVAQIAKPFAPFRAQPKFLSAQPRSSTDRSTGTLGKLGVNHNRPDVQAKASQINGNNYLRAPLVKPIPLAAEASGQLTNVVAQSSNIVAHPSNHAVSKSAGAGHSHHADHHVTHGDKEVKDYKSDHHHSVKDFENHDDHHKKAHHSEKGGHENEHHDEAGHYKKYHEGKKSHKAAKFGEKKGHKRGHKTKGYHNKFHRDEYHREHRFYDDYHKEGYHQKHGDSHSHYKKKQGGFKKGGAHKSGQSSKKHGKKDYSDKGKEVDKHKGFNNEGGHKKYHKNHKDYHKKQGNEKGKHYGYSKKH